MTYIAKEKGVFTFVKESACMSLRYRRHMAAPARFPAGGFSLAVLAAALVAASSAYPPAPPDVRFVEVTFRSANVSSGEIDLHGTLVLPVDYALPATIPGAVLVTGSGPNNRWEAAFGSTGQLIRAPLRDIAIAAAQRGVAVLTYDKRSCTALNQYTGCETPVCRPGNAPPGCLEAQAIRYDNFVSDAATAATYLRSGAGGHVAISSLALVGHSQGCTVVADTAYMRSDVATLVLLAGSGVRLDELLSQQSARQAAFFAAEADLAEKQGAAQATVLALRRQTARTMCGATAITQQFAMLINGTIPETPDHFLVIGGYVNASLEPTAANKYGVECPQSCVCSGASPSPPACAEPCTEVLRAGAILTQPTFLRSWYNATLPAARRTTWSGVNVRNVLLLNSYTDLLIPPSAYLPLHELVLNNLSRTMQQWEFGNPSPMLSANVAIFTNLTHDLVPYLDQNTPPYSVRADVLARVAGFLRNDTADQFSPSTPTASSDSAKTAEAVLGTFVALLSIALVAALVKIRKLNAPRRNGFGTEYQRPLV